MEIGFFEEFPGKTDFSKLKQLNFKPVLYIAASNLRNFQKYKERLRGYKTVWWYTLPFYAGYWISSYTPVKWIVKAFNQFSECNSSIMLDIEKPVLAPWMFIYQFHRRKYNRDLLCKLISRNENKLILCQTPEGTICEFNGSTILMCYTSLKEGGVENKKEILRNAINKGINKWGADFILGLGCIGRGIFGVEPQLTTAEMERDILISYEKGVNRIVIFRLGGVLAKSEFIDKINKINHNLCKNR